MQKEDLIKNALIEQTYDLILSNDIKIVLGDLNQN